MVSPQEVGPSSLVLAEPGRALRAKVQPPTLDPAPGWDPDSRVGPLCCVVSQMGFELLLLCPITQDLLAVEGPTRDIEFQLQILSGTAPPQ